MLLVVLELLTDSLVVLVSASVGTQVVATIVAPFVPALVAASD